MRFGYIGNHQFGIPDPADRHSTETHIAKALEVVGHEVVRYQEGQDIPGRSALESLDVVLWTRTKSLAASPASSFQMMLNAHRSNTPVIGMHLDIWWGLAREVEVLDDPFFQVDLLITADGGHDDRWDAVGVNHVWLPPAVSLAETEPGMFRSDLASPLAFVGSHDGGYHAESRHRHELVAWLKSNFMRDCAFWPRPGEHALRGAPLRDLYTSVDVLVGDSCFTGTGLRNYWSDRIPETIGRGGYLLHPMVEGLVEQGFTSETMSTWDAFDWDALGIQIDWALGHPSERKAIAAHGREVVRERHTYERRMEQLVELLYERKLLKRPRKAKP